MSGPGSPSLANDSTSGNDQLARLFNTAMISTRAESKDNFSEELFKLVKTPAFKSILQSVAELAKSEGCDQKVAAEDIVRTFRELDQLWSQYVYQEGVQKIRGPQPDQVSSVHP